MGQAWLKERRGYYDLAKEKRIERKRERGDRRMMRECRNMLKLIEAAHGIGSMEDKRTLDAERRKRTVEEGTEKEKEDSYKAMAAAKKREEEATRRIQEKEAAMEKAAEEQKVEIETRKQEALLKRTQADDAKFHLDMTKGTMTVDEMLKKSAEAVKMNEKANLAEAAAAEPTREVTTVPGFVVGEGVSHKSMEITSHFISDLTEEEVRGAPAAVAKAASLMDQVLGEGGMRRWSVKGMVDSSICRRELAWVIGRIPYKLVPKATVVQRIREQLEAVFPRRILNVWKTNWASFPIIVRGIVRTPALVEQGIADRLLRSEVEGVLWGDRRALWQRRGLLHISFVTWLSHSHAICGGICSVRMHIYTNVRS